MGSSFAEKINKIGAETEELWPKNTQNSCAVCKTRFLKKPMAPGRRAGNANRKNGMDIYLSYPLGTQKTARTPPAVGISWLLDYTWAGSKNTLFHARNCKNVQCADLIWPGHIYDNVCEIQIHACTPKFSSLALETKKLDRMHLLCILCAPCVHCVCTVCTPELSKSPLKSSLDIRNL